MKIFKKHGSSYVGRVVGLWATRLWISQSEAESVVMECKRLGDGEQREAGAAGPSVSSL